MTQRSIVEFEKKKGEVGEMRVWPRIKEKREEGGYVEVMSLDV